MGGLKSTSRIKTHVTANIKLMPVYLASACDEFASANKCQNRSEAIILALRTHPLIMKLVEAQRLEAKNQALRRRQVTCKEAFGHD